MMTTALTFQNTHFDVVEQNDQVWLSATDIAKALGYAREDSVSRIYDRNSDEFSNVMSMTVNLTVNGINNRLRKKSTRIFSLRGAHLIAMFSRTPIAKQFRKWVLDVLDKEAQPQTITPVQVKPLIKQSNWPTMFRTQWNAATFPFFGQTVRYLSFDISPVGNTFRAGFSFQAENHQLLHVGQRLGRGCRLL
ncbi:conserved hypothetical protein [Vibrio coralliirubri]|uniref:BRO-N domain-containing protein n=1 Tax=Vibrio coralliirubri TaxID=1516159 RepID=UPI000633BE8E|nr:BRO family protein [Vibrio coralliirubri]CDT98628.1 conserved hypothetical protein [Vibrio coralliirubri]